MHKLSWKRRVGASVSAPAAGTEAGSTAMIAAISARRMVPSRRMASGGSERNLHAPEHAQPRRVVAEDLLVILVEDVLGAGEEPDIVGHGVGTGDGDDGVIAEFPGRRREDAEIGVVALAVVLDPQVEIDRKSTRMNYSH